MAETAPGAAPGKDPGAGYLTGMKKLLELLVCILHPVAVILAWVDLASRKDIGGGAKLAWALFCLIPLIPFVYVLTGGDLW
jgi:hypothetical protein